MTSDAIYPRPGSHIWRRTDGGPTRVSSKRSGANWLTRFPGITNEELAAAELQEPAGHFVSDGVSKFEVERILNFANAGRGKEPVVILGPSKPPFGEWEELLEWTPAGT